MSILVIHPKDSTTDFLKIIYRDLNCTVIDFNISKSKLRTLINNHDRIIILGHGTEKGLLGFDRFIIDSNYVYLLRNKECIFIWCNADRFVNKYSLKGFHTGMFVSDSSEAHMYNLKSNIQLINSSNESFAEAVRDNLWKDNMDKLVIQDYEGSCDVIDFNKERIFKTKL
jgi:hypothetical protein